MAPHPLFALLSLLFVVDTYAIPLISASKCTAPTIRREWRSLTISERKDYIRANQCMMKLPSKETKFFSVNKNRYDDFVALHANATAGGINLDGFDGFEALKKDPFFLVESMKSGIHGTGTFLPWHRYAINIWEAALQNECGYKGAQPYWDWHLDTPEAGGQWEKSPLWDVEHGFGGNGAKANRTLPGGMSVEALTQLTKLVPGFELPFFGGSGGGCIQDGVFATHRLNIGPMGQMTKNNSRCITRGFNKPLAHASASKRSLSKVLSAKTFTEFRSWAEMGSGHMSMSSNGSMTFQNEGGDLHSIGHGGIGGEMGDPFNSVNDPLFWMHHTGMDRMWALWQEQDPATRAMDVGTASSMFDLAPLKHETPVWMGAMAPDVPALQVMDPLNRDGRGVLCYKYEGLGVQDYLPTPKGSLANV